MKTVFKILLRVGLPAAFGMLTGSAIARFGLLDVPRQDARTLLYLLPFLLLTVLAVHELGHLLGGRLMGFRFCMFAAGPLLIVRENERIRVKFNRALSLWGGIASALPVTFTDITRGMFVFTAFGPLTSFFFAAALWPVDLLAARTASLFSLLIGLVTLVPMQTGGFLSDGGRMLMFLREPVKAKRWTALAMLSSLSLAMVRPRDWPEEVLTAARALPDDSADDVAAAWLEHKAALDRGELGRAASAIDYVDARRGQLPKITSDLLSLDLAVFHGLFRGAPVEPPGAKPLFAQPVDLELARATSLLSKGERVEAGRTAQSALDRWKEPSSGACFLTRDLLREVVRHASA